MRAAIVGAVILALFFIVYFGENEPPPCTPMEGLSYDPCEGNLFSFYLPFDPRILAHPAPGKEPWTIRDDLDGGQGTGSEGHIVVRAQFMPDTARCTRHHGYRHQAYRAVDDRDAWVLKCYADVHVASYIVGTGPPTLTLVIGHMTRPSRSDLPMPNFDAAGGVEGEKGDGLSGIESILFLGPSREFSTESWEVFGVWDLERQTNGRVTVVHLFRDYWLREDAAYRPKVEMKPIQFTLEARKAHRSRLADYGGLIDKDAMFVPNDALPHLVLDANKLHDFYVETGAVNHPDGPPGQPPPVPGP